VIQFCCEHCGHKIGVKDGDTGKRGKCPACGEIFVVPAESTVIDFNCADCGRRISASRTYGGKKVICPKCKNTLVVPMDSETSVEGARTVCFTCSMCNRAIEEPESSIGKLIECPHCGSYVAVPLEETSAQEAEALSREGTEDDPSGERFEQMQRGMGRMPVREPEPVVERTLPWILDIFLYPSSKAGLATLAIIIFVPLLIGIVVRWLGPLTQGFPPLLVLFVPIAIIGLIIRILLFLYVYWYFCECIRDSAGGGIRAPETLGNTPGLGDLLWQWLRTIGCLVVFAAPTLIYYSHTRQTDAVFWALLAVGVFAFPMALLAVVMFDSFAGLNPALLIGSVFSTFLPYCAMIAVFALAVFLIIETGPNARGSAILSFIIRCAGLYLALVVAHLLGWFYHRYEQNLNWDV
jgi:DNA-directed RNA polymerase subunit RPC12/RpoP